MVLVQYSHKDRVKLPSFVCRGLITCIIKETGTHYILLVDHGISIELTRDKFDILPQDIVPDKYLTKTVGVYGILPICMRKNDIISNGTISNGSNTMAV